MAYRENHEVDRILVISNFTLVCKKYIEVWILKQNIYLLEKKKKKKHKKELKSFTIYSRTIWFLSLKK